MLQYSPRIYYWEPVAESDRPVIALIKGDKYSLLFDACNSRRHAMEVRDSIRQNNLPEPDFIVISHAHLDHWFGLSRFRGVSFCSQKTLNIIENKILQDWSIESVHRRVLEGTEHPMTEQMLNIEYGTEQREIELRTPDIGISESMTFQLGGIHCSFQYVGGNHAEDSAVLYVVEEKLLLLGDILYIRENNLQIIEDLYKTIKDYHAEYYIDSHENKIYDNQDLDSLIEEMRTNNTGI
ncbi:MAG: MBL fold metallo-hydrolase [Bacteroidota bacterium]